MGLTKTEIFSTEQNRIASMAKVLGHPARIAILQHLLKVRECICGDLVGEIGLSQPTISQHLREMKEIGLIKGSIEGTRVCYCIAEDKYEEMREAFENLLNQPLKTDCC